MRLSRPTIAKASEYYLGVLEIVRVAELMANREDAERLFRTRPLTTIEDAEKTLLQDLSSPNIRELAAFAELPKSSPGACFELQPAPSSSEWQIIEDVTSAIADAAHKGRKLSERSAVEELKRGKHRIRYQALEFEALRQRLRRARERQVRWQTYAISSWAVVRNMIERDRAVRTGEETEVNTLRPPRPPAAPLSCTGIP